MRFSPTSRVQHYERTRRKDLALLRRQRLEREKLPLFADMIAAEQPAIDSVMTSRAENWTRSQQDRRDQLAGQWRELRALLFSLPEALRLQTRAAWAECPYPGNPGYFAGFIKDVVSGKLDPHRPPWRYHPPYRPRTTPAPADFDEAFRPVGSEPPASREGFRVPGASYWGNLGGGLLTVVVVHEAAEDSQEVVIEVRPICSDDELAIIARLAVEIEPRARVRRFRFDDPEREVEEWARRERLIALAKADEAGEE